MQNMTRFPLHPILQNRWSPRAFENKPVAAAITARILEAALFAPSASNEQPWRFIVGFQGDETFTKINDSLVEFNQLWASKAPLLILACGKTEMNNKPGIKNNSYQYDTGQAVAHLTFQAMHEGLFVHQMTGFDPAKAAEILNIPEPYVALSVIAVGYIGNPEQLHEKLRAIETGPKKRFDFSEMVFSGNFGNPLIFND
jgi:nitroreductase